MKMFRTISLILAITMIFSCACCGKTTPQKDAKYKDSKYVGKWYNADSPEETLVYELKDDGTATYEGKHKGTWEETDNGISIVITKDKKEVKMTGYFIIAGKGFVARVTPENQHYLDEGKGELQLEFMLTEKTCVDCIKKDK